MTRLLSSPRSVWLGLVGLTLASLLVAEELNVRIAAISAVFLVAALKAEMVISHYMEAGRAERHWQVLYLAWVSGVTLLLVWGHCW